MGQNFRAFRVAKKVTESEIITSFYLEPCDGAPVWDVLPGQYLTLRVPAVTGPVLKTYSLSCDPSERHHHRITVKREAGLNGAPDGVGSCWLHDTVTVGDRIDIAAPRGTFVLNERSTRPVVLLSGGVGLTPMVSMLHRLKDSGRDVYFLHACENSRVHALRDEVMTMVDDRIRARFVYRTPEDGDQCDAQGMIDKAFMQATLPIDDYDAYLCGPVPFMAAMYQLLQELGVPKAQIAYEFFGKAASLDKLVSQMAPLKGPSKAASAAAPTIQALTFLTDPDAWAAADEVSKPVLPSSQGQVTFRKSNASADWDGAAHSLLELAENAGLEPEFSCRAGICNSCKCMLVSGEVEYFEQPLTAPEQGKVLICCSRPNGSVVLDI